MATRVIRKYPNRRLYDTAAGRYVNLEDIAAIVRCGEDVQVLDAKTGEDVTRVVLTQIIVEDAKDHGATLPVELLRQLILITDRAGRELLNTVETLFAPKTPKKTSKTRKKEQ
jgi:polyhydroxyalkanoate synthesis repressor PhaR